MQFYVPILERKMNAGCAVAYTCTGIELVDVVTDKGELDPARAPMRLLITHGAPHLAKFERDVITKESWREDWLE